MIYRTDPVLNDILRQREGWDEGVSRLLWELALAAAENEPVLGDATEREALAPLVERAAIRLGHLLHGFPVVADDGRSTDA